MNTLNRWLPLRWLIVLVPLAAAAGCQPNAEQKASLPVQEENPATPVRVTRPQASLSAGEARVTGGVRSKNETTISSKLTAQVLRIEVRVGDRVKKGQRVVVLDASQPAIALQAARASERLAAANLANAKLDLERSTTLHASGAIADANLDRAKTMVEVSTAQVEQAKAAVRSAQQQIADATLRAPFDGIVTARVRNPGDTVTAMPPSPILSIVDPDHLEARLLIPEGLAPLVSEGAILKAIPTPAGAPFELKVSAVSAVVDTMTRTIELIAEVAGEGDKPRPGSLFTVELGVLPSNGSLVLPTGAVRSDDRGQHVLTLVDGQVRRQDIAAKPLNPGMMIVASGLKESDVIVLDPNGTIKEGLRATPVAN